MSDKAEAETAMTDKPIAAGKSSFDLVDPEKVFAELNLAPGMVLLDVACGAGKYALAAAGRLEGRGTIVAVDLWAEGIAALREEAGRLGLHNIRAEVADVTRRLPLEDGSVDTALLATVLHDLAVEGTEADALREIARVLRPGGRLVIVEFDKVDSEPGPPAAIRLAPGEVKKIVVPCGFRMAGQKRVGLHNYLISFLREEG